MINVKSKVYDALCKAVKNVTDSYPTSWADLPAVQYMEEDNKVVEWTDDREQKSYVRYRIDIWDNTSTSAAALSIDAEIAGSLGLERTFCQDVDDPSHLKHKVMRYEAILEARPDGDISVYHQN